MSNNNEEIIVYPNPTCDICKTTRFLMFYNGKVECSNCGKIIWVHGGAGKDKK
jgi:uncharacterized Zn finger protein (UPF0148 family)